MTERQSDFELRSIVVVPARPGPTVRIQDLERGRDEVDEVLDDLFGEPDDRGPGPVDAVLLIGGASAVIAGQAASLPSLVTVGGIAAVLLGAVLPLRSLWRRAGSARRSRRLRSLLGDGVLLRIDHPSIDDLLGTHQRLLDASGQLAAAPRGRAQDVAHSALLEVASMLDGRIPRTAAEVEYVAARTHALEGLVRAVTDPRVGDGEPERRQAFVEARLEVEQLAGSSSLTAASELQRELLGTHD